MLIHGARAAILAAQKSKSALAPWLASLLARKHPNVAAVALASRNASIAWALLAHKRNYDPRHGLDMHLSGAVAA